MSHTTLVNAATLAAHLKDPNWIVFDCRHDLLAPSQGESAYAIGHVPGARFAHCDRDLAGTKNGKNGRHPLPAPEAFAEFLARAGVGDKSQIVAYDAQGGMFAARLWWLARWLGHSSVAVLDGGWPRWIAEGYPVATAVPDATQGVFVRRMRDLWVDAQTVSRDKDRGVLIDARAPDRFRGENETMDPVAGHIPGACNRFFRDNLAADGAFKSAATLREEFGAIIGTRLPQSVIHSCGSGVSACHNLLAMEIAGLDGSKLYPGSWSEWCADPARPVATGPG